MRIYLAGVFPWNRGADEALVRDVYVGAHILQSFYYINDFIVNNVMPSCKTFMLDSGAYTFRQQTKKSIDWDGFLERYADFINEHDIDLFFELDIDPVVGYAKVLQMREKLERLTGKQCIPVWHVSRGKEDFLETCERYRYISVGGLAEKRRNPKQLAALQSCLPWLIEQAHRNATEIHGLGYTSMNGLKENHFDSVDSSGWLTGNRCGFLYRFNDGKMERVSIPPGTKCKTLEVAIHNFMKWKKFADWAERSL